MKCKTSKSVLGRKCSFTYNKLGNADYSDEGWRCQVDDEPIESQGVECRNSVKLLRELQVIGLSLGQLMVPVPGAVAIGSGLDRTLELRIPFEAKRLSGLTGTAARELALALLWYAATEGVEGQLAMEEEVNTSALPEGTPESF